MSVMHPQDAASTIGGYASEPAPDQNAPSVNLFKIVHRLMRGRYLLAAALALVGAGAGAFLGYRSQTPMYGVEAKVLIRLVVDRLLQRSGEEGVKPLAQQFAREQAALITQERVIDQAMRSDAWKALKRGSDPDAVDEFRRSIRVSTDFDAPGLITVTFMDRQANAARIGVEEVARAFDDLFGQRESRERVARLQTLEQKRNQAQEEIATRDRKIKQETSDFGGVDGLAVQNKHHNDRLLAIKEQIADVELKLAGLTNKTEPERQPGTTPPDGLAERAKSGDITAEDIANVDLKMDSYLARRRELMREYNGMKQRGLGDGHRAVKRILEEIAAQDQQIEEYRLEYLETRVADNQDTPIDKRVETPDSLQKKLTQLRELEEGYAREAKEIGAKKSAVDQLLDENEYHRVQRDEYAKMIDNVLGDKAIQDNIGRIDVLLPQSTPSSPTHDRRVQFAVAGAMAGAGLPIALLVVLGLLNGRYRYSDEASEDGTRRHLLGILPRLAQNLVDAEEATAAAHCVHQIRTLLQVNSRDHQVYCITSSTAGDGKTSLSLAMGLSFAASGVRTLMVDLDLIGQGLSRSLKKRPEEGVGLALTAGRVDPENSPIVPVQIENLWLFPTARSDDRIASRLSQTMVNDLIKALRPGYQVIIIDTGPVLGSLEANFAAAIADGTILVVGQGQTRANVKQAFAQLDRLRARAIGFVFNLASHTDFRGSATTASFRSVRRDAPTPPQVPVEFPDLDPLPRAVALDTRR